jgi:protein-tyrosine-phosphatase
MAQVLLSARLRASTRREPTDPVVVRSAGIGGGVIRSSMDPVAAAVLRDEYGLEPGEHVPRRLSPQIVDHDGRDLVLTMSAAHATAVAVAAPDAWDRSFTFLEFAALADGYPRSPREPFAEYVARLVLGRPAEHFLSTGRGLDVPDPYGRGVLAVAETARVIDHAARVISGAL